LASTTEVTIAREFYEAFQRGDFERWGAIIDDNVLINSPVGREITGLDALKAGRARSQRLPSVST
jgi:hypothetical protein